MSEKAFSKKIVLHFPHRLVNEPIICKLVKDYNLVFNILKAYVTPREEGLVVLELIGKEADFKSSLGYLKKVGVKVEPLSQDVVRNDERCTHCGACVTVCPAGALVLEPLTRKIHFYENKCIACELCVRACPTRAMEIRF